MNYCPVKSYIYIYALICSSLVFAQQIPTESDSQFRGMGALYDLNSTSIVTDASNNVTSWADALGSSITYTRNSGATAITLGELGSTGVSAVQFTSDAKANKLVTTSSLDVQSIFLVNNIVSGTANTGLFGRNGADHGLRMNNSTDIRHVSTVDDYNWNSGQAQWLNGSSTNNTITSPNVLGVVGRAGQTGDFTTAIGGYIGSHNRSIPNGQIAEVLTFNFKLSDEEVKIVNTLFGNSYNFSMVAGSVYDTPAGYKADPYYLGKTAEDSNTGYFDVKENGDGGLGVKVSHSFLDSVGIILGNNDEDYTWAETDRLQLNRVWNLITLGEGLFDDPENTTVTFAFDFAAENQLEEYAKASDFSLLYSADGLTFTELLGSTLVTNTGNGYLAFEFTGNNLAEGYYTLGGTLPSLPVPEPSTWALLILGAIGLVWLRKK